MFKSKITYDYKNELIVQEGFDPETVGKTEAIMNIGNGYIGQRSANEEQSYKDVRDTFINGTFNKARPEEVTELPNIADTTRMDIFIDGEKVMLQKNNFKDYKKSLNLNNGEIVREYTYLSNSNKEINFTFKRFASFENVNNIFYSINVFEKSGKEFDIKVTNFIDGQMTNTGAMHFDDGEKRVYNNKTMELLQTTTQSNILIPIRVTIDGDADGSKFVKEDNEIALDRRQVKITTIKNNVKNFSLNKIATYTTSIDNSTDLDLKNLTSEEAKQKAREACESIHNKALSAGYENELNISAKAYVRDVLSKGNVEIESTNEFDQLSYKFARYHLSVFTPRHDTRLGIGAKGLSGEGYKGHSFWDTEMFITPVYNMIDQEQAKKLLEYRFLGLAGARRKASENGYKGAMYPWEAAWPTDGEVTPVWGGIDIISGKSTKIWSGFIEYHIIADIAYAIFQYYKMSGDQEFMDEQGYEMLIDTAVLWSSMAKRNDSGAYELLNVIGPNEYKEHVNNNSFTNYMAKWNIDFALDKIDNKTPAIEEAIKKLNLTDDIITKMRDVSKNIVLNKPNEDGIIGENDTFLSLPEVPNMKKYKTQEHVGSLFKDFNLEQVNKMQVAKQADLLILLMLQESLFSKEIKEKNFYYYEERTTHDSSLSLSSHAILASDLKLPLAYKLFEKSSRIDMGENMHSSDHGIHAASLAGMLQIIMNGFGGIRLYDGQLRVQPNLPKEWKTLKFEISYQGQPLKVLVDHSQLTIFNNGNKTVKFINNEATFEVLSGSKTTIPNV